MALDEHKAERLFEHRSLSKCLFKVFFITYILLQSAPPIEQWLHKELFAKLNGYESNMSLRTQSSLNYSLSTISATLAFFGMWQSLDLELLTEPLEFHRRKEGSASTDNIGSIWSSLTWRFLFQLFHIHVWSNWRLIIWAWSHNCHWKNDNNRASTQLKIEKLGINLNNCFGALLQIWAINVYITIWVLTKRPFIFQSRKRTIRESGCRFVCWSFV